MRLLFSCLDKMHVRAIARAASARINRLGCFPRVHRSERFGVELGLALLPALKDTLINSTRPRASLFWDELQGDERKQWLFPW